jgi:hypothetical protein
MKVAGVAASEPNVEEAIPVEVGYFTAIHAVRSAAETVRSERARPAGQNAFLQCLHRLAARRMEKRGGGEERRIEDVRHAGNAREPAQVSHDPGKKFTLHLRQVA